jgi:ectoine hydroxylase
MPDVDFQTIRDMGFATLPGLAAGDTLARLRAAVSELREVARGLTASEEDFILEAADIGGWAAWQRGTAAVPGVLRSANRIHVHVPEFDAVQRSLGLPELAGRPGGAGPGELVNSLLWAKPAKVGSAKPWHQDMAFAPPGFDTRGYSVVMIWIALDPATPRNGCLEFIPQSHRYGLLPHTGNTERGPGEGPARDAVEPHVEEADMPFPAEPVAVPLAPGSAVMFDGMVLHRSAANATTAEPRTAVSFAYKVPRPAWTRG